MSDSQIETLRQIAGKVSVGEGVAPLTVNASWWQRYRANVVDRLSPTATEVLEADARAIADLACPTANGRLDLSSWHDTRVRTGVVVGSVQSGKTASMLGLAALAIDRGVSIVIVLAGTRVALWLQTYHRLLDQLDGTDVKSCWKRNKQRVLVPDPVDVLGGADRASPSIYLGGKREAMQRAIRDHQPILVVVPKEDDHLIALARHLEEHTLRSSTLDPIKPITMLVLDDEADDASILDAREGRKLTPRLITHLWTGRAGGMRTRSAALYSTYVAYTATPQANYLQASHNPLSPRDFHAALRVPSYGAGAAAIGSTFREPRGLRFCYCGGEVFYRQLRGLPGDLSVAKPFPVALIDEPLASHAQRVQLARGELLGEALRAYFIAAAIQLLQQNRKISTLGDASRSRQEWNDLLPRPCTMMYHPSALKELHFAGAADIVQWSRGATIEAPVPSPEAWEDADLDLNLDVEGLVRRLASETSLWQAWVMRYQASVAALAPYGSFDSPLSLQWDDIALTLKSEVFPFVRLRVLNSDSRADDRPSFSLDPDEDDSSLFRAPADLLSIFVAGNVLSRGVTIEGLTTSLFLRSAGEPAADTQMQMQRWFGYRGAYLPYCRVFLFEDQLELFRQYHEGDMALRKSVVASASFGMRSTALAMVLEGEGYRATTKVDSRRVPLHPGPNPSIRILDGNLDVLTTQLSSGAWSEIEQPLGTLRGLIREEPIGLLEAAELLESMRYGFYRPPTDTWLHARWKAQQLILEVSAPLFRPPSGPTTNFGVAPAGCPYSIAAYLRFWAHALQRRDLSGLYPTDDPKTPWSMIDLKAYQAARPQFYIGLRYGSGPLSTHAPLAERGVRTMDRQLRSDAPLILETLWGTRGHGDIYPGDQRFDYCFHAKRPIPQIHGEDGWRPKGHPGLILFHVIRHANGESVALGLSLPHGGPDHIAALRGQEVVL